MKPITCLKYHDPEQCVVNLITYYMRKTLSTESLTEKSLFAKHGKLCKKPSWDTECSSMD